MNLASFRSVGTLAGLAFFGALLGCETTSPCGSAIVTRSIDGTMATGESEASAAERRAIMARHPDLVGDPERIVTPWLPHSEDVDLVAAGDDRCLPGLPCVVVLPATYASTYLRWNRPSKPGDYRLAELRAEICDNVTPAGADEVWGCAPLDGTLTVRAIAPPCEDDACGHFDADLVLAERPTTPPSGPFAFGAAHLFYDARKIERTCTSGGFGKGSWTGLE